MVRKLGAMTIATVSGAWAGTEREPVRVVIIMVVV
jgi:hypothetical protein